MYSLKRYVTLNNMWDDAFKSFDLFFNEPKSGFVFDGTKHVLEIKVPGYSKDDITIELVDDKLYIEGKSKKYGDFKREYWNISSEDVSATVENGILTIEVGSANAKRKKQLIKIK